MWDKRDETRISRDVWGPSVAARLGLNETSGRMVHAQKQQQRHIITRVFTKSFVGFYLNALIPDSKSSMASLHRRICAVPSFSRYGQGCSSNPQSHACPMSLI